PRTRVPRVCSRGGGDRSAPHPHLHGSSGLAPVALLLSRSLPPHGLRAGEPVMKIINFNRTSSDQPSLLEDERGLSTVEYVILLVLIAAGSIGLWMALGQSVYQAVDSANVEVDKVTIDAASQGDEKGYGHVPLRYPPHPRCT